MPAVIKSVNMVKTPRQQRSRDSLERILKAAETIIGSKGHEFLTIAEVVRRSDTSVGTVYARFPDKEALLHAVHERVIMRDLEDFREQVAAIDWKSLSLQEAIVRLAAIKRAKAKGMERLYEAFVVHGATDPVLRAEGYRVKGLNEDLEVEILMGHAEEIGHEDPQEAIRIASRIWQAAREEMVQRSKSGVPGPGGVPQDILMDKLDQVIIAYLKNMSRICEENGSLP
jgi:AcrR family transcriptional regulator